MSSLSAMLLRAVYGSSASAALLGFFKIYFPTKYHRDWCMNLLIFFLP